MWPNEKDFEKSLKDLPLETQIRLRQRLMHTEAQTLQKSDYYRRWRGILEGKYDATRR